MNWDDVFQFRIGDIVTHRATGVDQIVTGQWIVECSGGREQRYATSASGKEDGVDECELRVGGTVVEPARIESLDDEFKFEIGQILMHAGFANENADFCDRYFVTLRILERSTAGVQKHYHVRPISAAESLTKGIGTLSRLNECELRAMPPTPPA